MKLLSFGEIIWDVYPDCATLGGAPLNFAAHAAMQGAEAYVISAIGDDELGARALNEIGEVGVITSCIETDPLLPSGRCTVTLDKLGHPKYKIADRSAYDAIRYTEKVPDECDVIAFGTLALRYEENRTTLQNIFESCRYKEAFADINVRMPFFSKESLEFTLSHATVVKMSDEDMKHVQAYIPVGDDIREGARVISQAYPNIKIVLITCGADGSLCYNCKDDSFTYSPVAKANVVSTVGAGDSYSATFITRYINGEDTNSAMKAASAVSAYVVSHKEAMPRYTKDFLLNLLSDFS
jgi:fructokinase